MKLILLIFQLLFVIATLALADDLTPPSASEIYLSNGTLINQQTISESSIVIYINNISDESGINTSSIQLDYSGDQYFHGFHTLTINNGITFENGQAKITLTELGDGLYYLRFKVVDLAGNVLTKNSVFVNIIKQNLYDTGVRSLLIENKYFCPPLSSEDNSLQQDPSGELYLFLNQLDHFSLETKMTYIKSRDQGMTWDTPKPIFAISDSHHGLSVIDHKGVIHSVSKKGISNHEYSYVNQEYIIYYTNNDTIDGSFKTEELIDLSELVSQGSSLFFGEITVDHDNNPVLLANIQLPDDRTSQLLLIERLNNHWQIKEIVTTNNLYAHDSKILIDSNDKKHLLWIHINNSHSDIYYTNNNAGWAQASISKTSSIVSNDYLIHVIWSPNASLTSIDSIIFSWHDYFFNSDKMVESLKMGIFNNNSITANIFNLDDNGVDLTQAISNEDQLVVIYDQSKSILTHDPQYNIDYYNHYASLNMQYISSDQGLIISKDLAIVTSNYIEYFVLPKRIFNDSPKAYQVAWCDFNDYEPTITYNAIARIYYKQSGKFHANAAPASPNLVTIESLIADNYVVTAQPTFKWNVVDRDADDAVPKGYRLLLATTTENLLPSNNYGDVWDSKAVVATSSQHVKCPLALTVNQTYYWKVKTLDNDGVWGPYSSAHAFTCLADYKELITEIKDSATGISLNLILSPQIMAKYKTLVSANILPADKINHTPKEGTNHLMALDINLTGYDSVTFSEAVRLDLSLPSNISTQSMIIKYWDTSSSTWNSNGIQNVSINGSSVSFEVTHFTIFALMQDTAPPVINAVQINDALAENALTITANVTDNDSLNQVT